MKETREDRIRYRILKSREALEDARLLAQNKRWNACINRLYYSCFHIVSALLHKHNLNAKTHSGLKALFHNEFVNKKLVSKEIAEIFPSLHNWRAEGDYFDFSDFEEETVIPLIEDVAKFNEQISALISSEEK